MAPCRILVTGGTGYIGYRLLSELREHHAHEFSPVAIVRSPANAILIDRLLDLPAPPSEPPVYMADLLDLESLRRAVRGVHVVVHLAADMDMFPSTAGRVTTVNVQGTRNLLDACAEESQRTGIRLRFVFASSTEAMGPMVTDTTDEVGNEEEGQLNPDCEYGVSKGLAEFVVKEYEDRLDCVIIRLSGVYGPGERFFFHEFMSMVNAGLIIVSPGPLTGTISLAHIDDAVQGLLLAIRRPEAVGQTYILTSDESHSYKEIVAVMAKTLRRSQPLFTIPLPIAKWIIACVAPLANLRKQRIFMFVSCLHHAVPLSFSAPDRCTIDSY
jgi:dihydroflavonol-4-reductase